MTSQEWEAFIHSEEAVGSAVRLEVSEDERAIWPLPDCFVKTLADIQPGSRVVQFDTSIANGAVGRVVQMSNCGWLKVEFADHGVIDVPGWYLRPGFHASDPGAEQLTPPGNRGN